MSHLNFPQARCSAGVSRRDITPPVGIYHRMWGAATHDRSTGVHRPLLATALVLESLDAAPSGRQVIVAIDHCLLRAGDMAQLRLAICRVTGTAENELQIAFSHTHGAGLMDRSRAALPGGNFIGPYLDRMAELISEAIEEAKSRIQLATIMYGLAHCDLATHRDFWDEASRQFVCGFNASGPTDSTLQLARIDDDAGKTISTVVNYACHPTTLAWDNTLISPDYIGAMRELVEQAHGGLCVFLQGASGDLGPREGYVGDPAVADRNGRRLGYAVLSALEAMPKAGMRYKYVGPVVSGATIGVWQDEPVGITEAEHHTAWRSRIWTLELPYRSDLPTVEQTEADFAQWQKAEEAARQADDAATARDCRAHVERMTRQLMRVAQLPPGERFPLSIRLWRLGNGYWLMLEGEYYHALQRTLRERFPAKPIVVATVVNGWRPAYLPTRETYGLGIYQEQVAVLAPGSLEAVIDAVSEQIANWEKT
jgi:hypothetical protein